MRLISMALLNAFMFFYLSMVQHKKAFFLNTLYSLGVKIIYMCLCVCVCVEESWALRPIQAQKPRCQIQQNSSHKRANQSKICNQNLMKESGRAPEAVFCEGWLKGKREKSTKRWRTGGVQRSSAEGIDRRWITRCSSQVGPTMGLWANATHVKAMNQLFTQRSENKTRIKLWKPPLNPLQVAF